jgi:type II secretory pathway predicted ATPase ExeA
VVVIDEAHLLGDNTDLESLRMLTDSEMGTGSHFALLLVGQPTRSPPAQTRGPGRPGQRISTRFTIIGR